nr:MBL fold metallo-hydrolase [Melissococcus plutonius]
MAELDYQVIASGSKGNAVRIKNVMVDCGIPFKKMKEALYDCNYLLITHIHSDHIRPSTLQKIKDFFPKIKVIGNWEVHQHFGVDVICNAGYDLQTKDYVFLPFEGMHDVLCYGYTWQVDGYQIIYCTDTSSLKNSPELAYDYLFLESNYDKNKIEAIENAQEKYGYDVIAGARRHLSTQDCKAFYYTHRKDKESKLIELHKSARFY